MLPKPPKKKLAKGSSCSEGAQPPAVKGLAAIGFSEAEEGVVERVEVEVAQATPGIALEQRAVRDELVHRHELHRGHAEVEQVLDHRVGGEPQIGAAMLLGDTRVPRRHPLDIDLAHPREQGGVGPHHGAAAQHGSVILDLAGDPEAFPEQIAEPLVKVSGTAVAGEPLPSFHLALWHGFGTPLMMSLIAIVGGITIVVAAALAFALGVSAADVRRGLTSMTQAENPGRGNVFDVDGFKVIIDFAHNPQAIEALLDMAAAMQGKRKVLCFAQAGDRPDDLIRELARNAWDKGLDRVIVSELAHYYRGRNPGEVFGLIRDELLRCGASEDQIEHNDEEIESFDSALAWARPGDLVIMLALERSPALYERLKTQQ